MPSSDRAVPIYHRSPRFSEIASGPFRVTNAAFDCRCVIEPHYHDRPNVGVMLEGSFDLTFGSRTFACTPGVLFVEPAGETHCNRVGRAGASVLALQPDPCAPELDGVLTEVFTAPSARVHTVALGVARRIAGESQHADEFAPLMIQGLTLELLATVARRATVSRRRAPPWLVRVEERLAANTSARTSVTELAQDAGVHASHLAREFRQHYGRSLGGFLLERRLEWASRELLSTHRPISEIALEAGFADQSHFTRRFRTHTGLTPRHFRLTRQQV